MPRHYICCGKFFEDCAAKTTHRCCDQHRSIRVPITRLRVCNKIVNPGCHKIKRYNFGREEFTKGWRIKYYKFRGQAPPKNEKAPRQLQAPEEKATPALTIEAPITQGLVIAGSNTDLNQGGKEEEKSIPEAIPTNSISTTSSPDASTVAAAAAATAAARTAAAAASAAIAASTGASTSSNVSDSSDSIIAAIELNKEEKKEEDGGVGVGVQQQAPPPVVTSKPKPLSPTLSLSLKQPLGSASSEAVAAVAAAAAAAAGAAAAEAKAEAAAAANDAEANQLWLVAFADDLAAEAATQAADEGRLCKLVTANMGDANIGPENQIVLFRYCNQCHDFNPWTGFCASTRSCLRKHTGGVRKRRAANDDGTGKRARVSPGSFTAAQQQQFYQEMWLAAQYPNSHLQFGLPGGYGTTLGGQQTSVYPSALLQALSHPLAAITQLEQEKNDDQKNNTGQPQREPRSDADLLLLLGLLKQQAATYKQQELQEQLAAVQQQQQQVDDNDDNDDHQMEQMEATLELMQHEQDAEDADDGEHDGEDDYQEVSLVELTNAHKNKGPSAAAVAAVAAATEAAKAAAAAAISLHVE